MNATILVVDDEHDLVNLLQYNLKKENYQILSAYDGTSALELTWAHRPDLIVLDVMLPDMSGVEICKEIKANEHTKKIPIIMLTAKSSERDRIEGFESGAEDYVVKPFSPKELMLRIKAMLNRTQPEIPKEINAGTMQILPDQFRVIVDGEEAPITQLEFQILMALVQAPNVVKSREQILDDVWKEDAAEVLDRTVDAHVKRLRSKLGSARDMIETVRGVGYRFNDTAPAAALTTGAV